MKKVWKQVLAGVLGAGLLFVLPITEAQGQGDGAFAPGSGRMVRGTVTAVAPDHLTVKTESGETFQVALTPNTQVHRGRELAKIGDVHAGDGIGAMGEIDVPNKTVHALYLFVVDADQMKKAREAMGKTYIAGKITAINELKISILRADGVAQTITVDEDTSFKRASHGMGAMMGGSGIGPGTLGPGAGDARQGGPGAESITLADVKVGDTVAGPGALKSGMFVPTQLYIGDPATGGRRHGTAGGNPAALNGEPKQ